MLPASLLSNAWFWNALALLVGVMVGIALGWGVGSQALRGKCRKQVEQAKRKAHRAAHAECSERLALLDEVAQTMTATLNYQKVLELALDVAIRALTPKGDEKPVPLVAAVLLFGEDGLLHVAIARRFTLADLRVALSGARGALAKAVEQRQAVVLRSPARDPELRQIVALHATKSAYLFPLTSGLDVYGVLLYAHPEPDFFTPARLELLEFLGRQAMAAIQNARLYHDLEREKQRLTEVEEEARKKLARDLHDGPTQTIAAIAMRLELIRRLLEKNPQKAAEELSKVEELARHTTKEIRHLLFTLRPLVLETDGLVAALQAMAEKFQQLYQQNVIIEADESVVEALDSGQQATVFAIAEEAVNNARKHAQADHIWVRLKRVRPDIALLEIQDDGVGFDLDAVTDNYEYRGSLGMVNMQERAALINGHLELHSARGNGTTVRLWIPLSSDAADRLRQGRLTP